MSSGGLAEVQHIHLPRPGRLLRTAGLHLLESFGLPITVFLVVRATAGTSWALLAGLLVAWAAIGGRLVLRTKVPAVLMISAALLLLQTVLAFVTGQTWIYLLQPALAKGILALMFGFSAVRGRPIIGQLAQEIVALPDAIVHHEGLKAVFWRLTVFWSALFALLAGGVATMVVTLSVAQVLLGGTVATVGGVLIGAALSFVWFRRHLHREGLRLGFSPAAA